MRVLNIPTVQCTSCLDDLAVEVDTENRMVRFTHKSSECDKDNTNIITHLSTFLIEL